MRENRTSRTVRGRPVTGVDAQVSDTEVYLQQQLPERERAIKLLLKQQGVDWPKSLTGVDRAPLVKMTLASGR